MSQEEAKARFLTSLAEVLALDVDKIVVESADYYWEAAHFAFQVMVHGTSDADAMETALQASDFKDALSTVYARNHPGDSAYIPIVLHSEDVYVSEVFTNHMIITHHSAKEFYKQHLCNYNKHAANKCECVCWGDRFYDETSVVGEQTIIPSSISTSSLGLSDNNLDTVCQYVEFAEALQNGHVETFHEANTVAAPVKVITNTWFGNDMLQFEPVTTWVAHTTTFGFKLCIQGSDSFWRTYTEEQNFAPVKVQYFAWQYQMPLYQTYVPRLAQNGREVIASSWTQAANTTVTGLTKCIEVAFETPYSERPLVTGSMERVPVHAASAAMAMATTWIETIEKTHFKVCAFREAAEASDDDKAEVANLRAAMREAADSDRFMEAANIQRTLEERQTALDGIDEEAVMFTWFAFPKSNPGQGQYSYKDGALPRFVAGTGHLKADAFHQDTSALDQGDDLFVTCKAVRYDHAYDRIPAVLAVANHQDHGAFHAGMVMQDGEWKVRHATAEHKPVITYVRDNNERGFTVCSRLLDNDGDHSILHWDYVSFLPMEESAGYRGNITTPAYIPGVHPVVAGISHHWGPGVSNYMST